MATCDSINPQSRRRSLRCSSMVAQLLLGFAQRSGCTEDLPTAVGLSAAELGDVDTRIPLSALLKLWEVVATRVGDDSFGLTVAQAPPSGIISVIQLAAQCSPNLGELWRRVIRFQHLAVDGAGIRLEEQDGLLFLRFRPPDVGLVFPRYVAEFALGSCLVNGRRATGAPLLPRAVRFAHGRPRDAAPYQRLLGVPVLFDQPCSEIEFEKDVQELPIRSIDPTMSAVMERYAEEWLSRLDVHVSFVEQVQRQVYTELQSGVPSASVIARRLHLSERSFSRRLQQEGVSYPKLVDLVRKELAAVYLNKRNIKLTEVAFLLGFSEISAFYRAYRRWTGMTPVQARTLLLRQ